MKWSTTSKLVLLLSLSASLTLPAGAAALYVEKAIVKTSSEKSCLSFAGDVARKLGLQNLHANNLEVAGEKSGAYVSTTCIARGGQPAMAVVSSVSDSFDAAQQLGHAFATNIKGITCFEGC
jgi:hypothetical protein